jgi:hypothetical protein
VTLFFVLSEVPSLYTTVNGPVPDVDVHVSWPVPVAQSGPLADSLPCGRGFTVIVADPVVKPLDRVHVLASVTVTKVSGFVLVTGFVYTLNAVPLVTLFFVLSEVPSLYTTVNGPVPDVAVQVSWPVPVAQSGPLAVRLPCGRGFTVIVADPVVKPLDRVHVLASVTDTRV